MAKNPKQIYSTTILSFLCKISVFISFMSVYAVARKTITQHNWLEIKIYLFIIVFVLEMGFHLNSKQIKMNETLIPNLLN